MASAGIQGEIRYAAPQSESFPWGKQFSHLRTMNSSLFFWISSALKSLTSRLCIWRIIYSNNFKQKVHHNSSGSTHNTTQKREVIVAEMWGSDSGNFENATPRKQVTFDVKMLSDCQQAAVLRLSASRWPSDHHVSSVPVPRTHGGVHCCPMIGHRHNSGQTRFRPQWHIPTTYSFFGAFGDFDAPDTHRVNWPGLHQFRSNQFKFSSNSSSNSIFKISNSRFQYQDSNH